MASLAVVAVSAVGARSLLAAPQTCYLESDSGPVAAEIVGPDDCAGDGTLLAENSTNYWTPIGAEHFQAWQRNERSYYAVQTCSVRNGGTSVTIYYGDSAIGSAFGPTVCQSLQRDGWTAH